MTLIQLKDSLMQEQIEVGYQAFASDGGEEFGAVLGNQLRTL